MNYYFQSYIVRVCKCPVNWQVTKEIRFSFLASKVSAEIELRDILFYFIAFYFILYRNNCFIFLFLYFICCFIFYINLIY